VSRRAGCLILFHPDCHRRLRRRTGSADPAPRWSRRSRAPWTGFRIPPVGNCAPPWE